MNQDFGPEPKPLPDVVAGVVQRHAADFPPPALFSPEDFYSAHVAFGAMCGHGALAAALGMPVKDVMDFFPPGGKGWVNIPIMETALAKVALKGMISPALLKWGWAGGYLNPTVTLIQFLGPWMEEGVPAAARCQHRHWVAVKSGLIWDVNTEKWQTRAEWEAEIPARLMPKRGTGWEAFRSFTWREKIEPPRHQDTKGEGV